MAHYTAPPVQAESLGTGVSPVKPDVFRVESDEYPRFAVSQRIKPPTYDRRNTEAIEIEESDVWKVSHKVGARYIIQSKSYNERQCYFVDQKYKKLRGGSVNIFGKCLSDYEYGIYISGQGEIDGGWELLPSDKILWSNRYMYMSWRPEKNYGWPEGRVFRALPKAAE